MSVTVTGVCKTVSDSHIVIDTTSVTFVNHPKVQKFIEFIRNNEITGQEVKFTMTEKNLKISIECL